MDRVKYLTLQITRLLPKSIDDIVEKWSNLGEDNLKLIHCAKCLEFDTPKAVGGSKTEGLDDGENILFAFDIWLNHILTLLFLCFRIFEFR